MEKIKSKITKLPEAGQIIASRAYAFKFTNYSTKRGFGIGKYSVSSTFKSGDLAWAIYFYPKGKSMKKGYGDSMSFVIKPKSEAPDHVTALFKLVLADQSGKERHKIHTYSGSARKGCKWGSEQYLSRDYLLSSGYLKDDCLLVGCWIGILGSDVKDSVKFYDYLSPPMQLKDLEVLIVKETAVSRITDNESWLQLNKRLLFDGDRNEIQHYLKAVDKIHELMISDVIIDCESECTNVMDMAMKRLQLEFKGILKHHDDVLRYEESYGPCVVSSTASSSSVSTFISEFQETDYIEHGALSSDHVNHLQSIVQRLNSAGHLGKCVEVYQISRKSMVDKCLLQFGVGKWSISDIRGWEWESFARKKVKLWIRAANICFRIIFPREKQTFEQIFQGVSSPSCEKCFREITKDAAQELCRFACVITSTLASVQMLFDVLDMFNCLSVIMPEIKTTFYSVSSVHIYIRVAKTVHQVAVFVRRIFSNFEYSLLHEQSNTPVPGGTVHSMTRYTLNYVSRILDYKQILTQIIDSKPTTSSEISYKETQFLEVGERTPLALHLIWIMIILKFNLEGKSKYYEDTSSQYFFVVNNVNYIIMKIEASSELLEMIGEDYIKNLHVSTSWESYLDTWDRVLFCLRDEGLHYNFVFYRMLSKSALKKRFTVFNSELGKICTTQSKWLIEDSELRCQMHLLILEKVIPAYESFLVKYRDHIDKGRCPEKYIKWPLEDVKKAVHALFVGHCTN